MTDSDLRAILLNYYYQNRRNRSRIMPDPSELQGTWDEGEIERIASQLHNAGLVDGIFPESRDGRGFLGARIESEGVDVVEGNRDSPVAITNNYSNTFNINNSTGVQAGQNNVQHVNVQHVSEALIQIAHGIAATEDKEERDEAAGRLKTFIRHPAFIALLGAAAEPLVTEVVQILGGG